MVVLQIVYHPLLNERVNWKISKYKVDEKEGEKEKKKKNERKNRVKIVQSLVSVRNIDDPRKDWCVLEIISDKRNKAPILRLQLVQNEYQPIQYPSVCISAFHSIFESIARKKKRRNHVCRDNFWYWQTTFTQYGSFI